MKAYKALLHQQSYQKAKDYQEALRQQKQTAGNYLAKKLNDIDLSALSTEQFLEKLVQTKKPQIFAESDVEGNGSDWNQTELSILGDIGMAVPVQIYDNGRHSMPKIHPIPFEGMLLYTAGALLRSSYGKPADWAELVEADSKTINKIGYYQLYERRLLPLLHYADSIAKGKGKKALITIPGLGCGQFAGIFKGRLGKELQQALIQILEQHGAQLPNIQAIYYDPYQECQNETFEINNIGLLVRPLTAGNHEKSQLSVPKSFNEEQYDFSACFLFSFVAWDHVSWPGNDFYVGARATDDGVKAAATSSMFSMTGIEGAYSEKGYHYKPPMEFRNWNEVIIKNKIQLNIVDNLIII